jgi:outer membrane murein-binding lipoprotein Lpp
MGVKAFHCDNISQEFDDSQLPIVKEWIEKRDSLIVEKDKQLDILTIDLAENKKKYDTSATLVNELNNKIDELNGQIETLQSELKKRSDNADSRAYIKTRRQLERVVCSHLDSLSDEDLDELTDRQLQETLITANYDFQDLGSRSDEVISAMFDMAVKYSSKKNFKGQLDSISHLKRNDAQETVNIEDLMNAKRTLRG